MNIEINSNEAILNIACIMAVVDNEIHPSEIKMIKEIALDFDLDPDICEKLFLNIENNNDFENLCIRAIDLITDPKLQKIALNIVTRVSTADNFIKEKEYLFMQLVVDKWGFAE